MDRGCRGKRRLAHGDGALWTPASLGSGSSDFPCATRPPARTHSQCSPVLPAVAFLTPGTLLVCHSGCSVNIVQGVANEGPVHDAQNTSKSRSQGFQVFCKGQGAPVSKAGKGPAAEGLESAGPSAVSSRWEPRPCRSGA